ncbi:MAG: phenylalanine--tRNA ligase subunit beta [Candidatus Omnitrophica bacterium]|nr:phenylalanine--tRNA ligase subunit beta [Candidatus Omnitrophota bacterium]
MKISYNWLKEYVGVKNSAKQVAQWLTMAGLEVTSLEEKGKDSVLEIEVTTNRPDWLSVIGVAREVSAVTGKQLKVPKTPNLLPITNRDKQIKVEVEDKLLCPRYTARIVDGVRVGPSPDWLKARLEAVGVRPVNNVVDITNFCLLESGQPLHAFDYDKLSGQKIVVRKAKKGERMLTIDNVQRELDNEMLVITDEKRPIAIAGVMGGLDTEVTESTKTVLIESACFDPISVRRTQRKLVLTTDSSYRFERGIDLEGVALASNRAAKLMVELCGGKIGIVKDVGIKAAKTNILKLSLNKTNKILNLELTPIAAKRILESLGLKVSGAQEKLRVEAPSFRKDLKREEDLIEEITRIYGYDKIPTTIPMMVGHSKRKEFQRKISELARRVMVSEGMEEVVNYSLVGREDLKKIAALEDSIIAIKNPASNQQEVMRTSLIPGILNAAKFSINRKVEDFGIFELSNVYSISKDRKRQEEQNLCILMSGRAKNDWRQKTNTDFFELKGVVETLLENLGINNYEFSNSAPQIFYPERSAVISVNKNEVGVIGELKKSVLSNFDIKKEVFLCEIKFGKLIEFVNVEKRFTTLAKFLPATRDISLIIEKDVPAMALADVIKESGGELLTGVELFDEYFGGQIPAGKRGLTFSVQYLAKDEQLTENQIEKVHNKIKEALVAKFKAVIR